MSGGLLEEAWWGLRPGPAPRALRLALAPAGALFRLAATLRGAAYDRGLARAARAGVPVISVGNVAVGGAGKTPATAAIAARLQARGRRVAILSRGYGAVRGDPRVVSDGGNVLLDAAEGGDEPVLLARRLPGVPVLCGPRRAELARRAVDELGADVLVLDDGFQHRGLGRDLDVVLLDAANPFGNGRCLPAGPNREPRSALRRAGRVWLSRVDQVDGPGSAEALARLRALAREATGAEPVESRHAPEELLDGTLATPLGLSSLQGQRVLLLSGLARPGSFRRTVEGLGAGIGAELRHPDHHRFSRGDVEEALREAARSGCARIVTTEKDALRLPADLAAHPSIAVLRIRAEIVRGGEGLDAALDAALASGGQGR
ncbi:MAG TPA: tetraacyldisaccharide 4'-kinase [Anaeromyxobacteraceae bacterium]|nr:tetraacyldisaccharide 4'-kinase [Anaeromyxobacteraceae bacterium]